MIPEVIYFTHMYKSIIREANTTALTVVFSILNGRSFSPMLTSSADTSPEITGTAMLSVKLSRSPVVFIIIIRREIFPIILLAR